MLVLLQAVLAIPNAVVATLLVLDRWKSGNRANEGLARPLGSVLLSTLMLLFAVALAALSFWNYRHPPVQSPLTIERTVQVPCSINQQQTGTATARGKGAVAHSGNGDVINQPKQ